MRQSLHVTFHYRNSLHNLISHLWKSHLIEPNDHLKAKTLGIVENPGSNWNNISAFSLLHT